MSDVDRAAFLAELPDSAELRPLCVAFEQGDYAALRRLAVPLLARPEGDELREAAEELMDRIEPDPIAKRLLFASLALFLIVVFIAYAHAP